MVAYASVYFDHDFDEIVCPYISYLGHSKVANVDPTKFSLVATYGNFYKREFEKCAVGTIMASYTGNNQLFVCRLPPLAIYKLTY